MCLSKTGLEMDIKEWSTANKLTIVTITFDNDVLLNTCIFNIHKSIVGNNSFRNCG